MNFAFHGSILSLSSYLSCEWKERKGDVSKEPLKFDKDTLKGCYPKVSVSI